jgi:two-component system cell cycle response regulator DivK
MGPLVLVVEDFADARAMLCELLEHHGYRTVGVRDGRAALEEARTRRPDLIVLDLSIPLISGWDVARTLKDDLDLQSTPILALTAHAHRFSIERARASGCDHVMVKPVPHDELLAAIGLFVAARRDDPSGVTSRVGPGDVVEETRGASTRRPKRR